MKTPADSGSSEKPLSRSDGPPLRARLFVWVVCFIGVYLAYRAGIFHMLYAIIFYQFLAGQAAG